MNPSSKRQLGFAIFQILSTILGVVIWKNFTLFPAILLAFSSGASRAFFDRKDTLKPKPSFKLHRNLFLISYGAAVAIYIITLGVLVYFRTLISEDLYKAGLLWASCSFSNHVAFVSISWRRSGLSWDGRTVVFIMDAEPLPEEKTRKVTKGKERKKKRSI